MFGYVPLGMAFGILLFVFAGAAQFMAIGLLTAQAGLLEVAVSTLALNSRHIFFGLSVLGRYRARGLKKAYLIFGLTDETYSLITSTEPRGQQDEQDYYLTITALNQSYWLVGCTLGAVAGSQADLNTAGMDFAMTALFLVLLIEQWTKISP